MLNFIKKWLWCSWMHRKHRCYPTVWDEEGAKSMDIPYKPNMWHCTKCTPCSRDFKI